MISDIINTTFTMLYVLLKWV